MKKILFAAEFYEHAADTFRYAVELAACFEAKLLVMHAYGKPDSRFSTEKTLLERKDKVLEKLVGFVTEHLPKSYREKISIDYLAVYAYPIEGILDTALEQEVDLIVMGMTGKTNALGSILGNTTLNVLAKADCQVLMIPGKAKFAGIDHLLYTVDFDFRDLEAIHYLKTWIQDLDAHLHTLHVIETDENEWTILKNMNILRETFKKEKTIDFYLRHGDFRQEIEKFARSKKADIVAMISHKRNFITRLVDSSLVEGVAKHIHLPLLVIKDDAYQFDEAAWEWVELVKSIA